MEIKHLRSHSTAQTTKPPHTLNGDGHIYAFIAVKTLRTKTHIWIPEPDSTQAPGPRFPLIEEDAATLRYPPRPFLPIRAHNDTFGRPFVIILRGRISTAAREKRRAGKVDAVDGRFSERNGVR